MENISAPKQCCLFVCCYVTVNKKSLSGIDFSSIEKVLKFAFLTKKCLSLLDFHCYYLTVSNQDKNTENENHTKEIYTTVHVDLLKTIRIHTGYLSLTS